MTQEALKLALEALEEAWYHVGTFQPTERAIDLYDEARTAIKEALAQKQEPIAMLFGSLPVYDRTTPPQRTWVDLTDEEIDNINYTSAHMLAREVLAKFKEKNT